MPRSQEEASVLRRFALEYQRGRAPVMRAIERSVCGCDYGGTSWTTRVEAHRIAQLMELAPDKRLLDLGAGTGWPGLYLAELTGCDLALVDIPIEGLQIAAARARSDSRSGVCWIAAADASELPFASACFDAIGQSDLLCCLEAKLAVLRECRRVARGGAHMVFSVISIAPGLTGADQRDGMEAGPAFKVERADYPPMLEASGWRYLERIDLTGDYAAAIERLLGEEESHANDLIPILGEAGFTDRIARRRRAARAIRRGLLQRDIFSTSAQVDP